MDRNERGILNISVVIPAYNRRDYVTRAIDSVQKQTVPVEEIIVVDDGSTDGTAELVRKQYGTTVRVLTQENRGVSAARNHGIQEACGDWIAFLDSDDVWLPRKVERQIEALSLVGGDLGVCFTDNVFDGDPSMDLTMFQEKGFVGVPKFGTLQDAAQYIVSGREPFFTSSLLVRRSIVNEVSGFDETLVIGEDTDLFFRLSFRTAFCFAAEPLVRIDRTPSRPFILCDVCSDRGDRKYDSLERWYSKWLSMPEVVGTKYEEPVRELLRLVYYSSIEAKIHDFRIKPALNRIAKLKALGTGYSSILANLFWRKLEKSRTSSNSPRRKVGWEW